MFTNENNITFITQFSNVMTLRMAQSRVPLLTIAIATNPKQCKL